MGGGQLARVVIMMVDRIMVRDIAIVMRINSVHRGSCDMLGIGE